MSLGSQQVIGVDQKPLFDVIAARGVSALALLHLPKGATLPPAVVCGGTNHVTKLAEPVDREDETVFLVRMTCGACIAPTSDTADYDAIAAVGLEKAATYVLNARVVMLVVKGCSRQVSQHGQIQWLEVPASLKTASKWLTPRGEKESVGCTLPAKAQGIFIQYGAGGGGFTRAFS